MQDPATHTAALSRHAVPLDTADPATNRDADRSDLEPIADALNDATVIGLGEATHGTREFFQLKDRLIRYLVAEEGLRLVGMESNFAETMAIDRYITQGEGSVLDALENIYFWTWDTEEVVAMLEWLREFNEGRSRDDQVRFWGYDAQYTTGPAAAIQEYLAAVDPDVLADHDDTLQMLQDRDPRIDSEGDREARVDTAHQMVAALREVFDANEQANVDARDRRSFDLARQYLRTIDQTATAIRAELDDDIETMLGARETAMAENVTWILDQSPHDRIALWAHNEHIRRGTMADDWGETRTMGDRLAERYGDEYYTLGFDFGRGELQGQIEKEGEEGRELGACVYGDPAPDTLTATFDDIDHPLFFVDVQGAVDTPELTELLESEQRIRSVGAFAGDEAAHWAAIVPADVYDGLIFVQETTRAVPNERES